MVMTSTEPPTPVKSATDALRSLGSSREAGLTAVEARVRLEREDTNEVPEKRTHPLARFAGKFWGLPAWMLELIVSPLRHSQQAS